MIDRAIAKAQGLRQSGAIAVVDAGGNVVSIARMNDSPVASIRVSRAKAYVSAVQGRPSAGLAATARERPEIFSAFQAILPYEAFPGPGGMPILKGGRVVGGIATGGGIGPYTEIPGVDPARLIVDGQRANAEDLVICTALGIPYQSQHGDRELRETWPRTGSPDSDVPLGRDQARRYADAAIQHASELGVPVGVAVVDEMGRMILVDKMDDAPLVSADMAEAKAMTALKFQRPTSGLTEEFRGRSARMRAIERMGRFTILAMGGGIPLQKDGRCIGAIGVTGSGASVARYGGRRTNDEEIALAAIGEAER
jgi:uncharacterized protein GlcG (DUF336 family)